MSSERVMHSAIVVCALSLILSAFDLAFGEGADVLRGCYGPRELTEQREAVAQARAALLAAARPEPKEGNNILASHGGRQ